MGFPMTIGDWHGRRSALESNVLEALQISDYVISDYSQDKNAPPINLYIAYYDVQKVGVVVHSPSSCIPGGGWKIINDKNAFIPMAGLPDIEVKRIVIGMGANKQLVYYWFDERGRSITTQIALKWWLLRDAILEHRTDGSLIRLVTPIAPTETEGQADVRLGEFLNAAYPQIKTYLPKGL
jgi:EpsI family protein